MMWKVGKEEIVRIEKGKKGLIGVPFCLIDRKDQNKVKEGEKWVVKVIRMIRDRKGEEVPIVRPVRRIYSEISEEGGWAVYCGRVKVGIREVHPINEHKHRYVLENGDVYESFHTEGIKREKVTPEYHHIEYLCKACGYERVVRGEHRYKDYTYDKERGVIVQECFCGHKREIPTFSRVKPLVDELLGYLPKIEVTQTTVVLKNDEGEIVELTTKKEQCPIYQSEEVGSLFGEEEYETKLVGMISYDALRILKLEAKDEVKRLVEKIKILSNKYGVGSQILSYIKNHRR